MSESKHTPGPWRLSPHYKTGWKGVAAEPTPNRWQGIYEPIPGQELGSRSAIVTVGIKGGEVDDYWLNISEANARLIAAAPALLSIAERWLALDGGSWAVDRHAAEKARLEADTRAVIAKARSESAP